MKKYLVLFLYALPLVGQDVGTGGFTTSTGVRSKAVDKGQTGTHGFVSTGDNPFIPQTPDVSGVPVRSHLQNLDIEKKKDAAAQAAANVVIERLKNQRIVEATQAGKGASNASAAAALKHAEQPFKGNQPSVVSEDLGEVFSDPALNQRTLTINTPAMDVKKVLETIGRLAGISFFIDQDVTGKIGALHIQHKTAGEILRLITSSNKPPLAVIKQGDVFRVMLYDDAQKQMTKTNDKVVHKVIPIQHARMNDKFKQKVEGVWNGLNGEQKDPNKFLYIDDEEKKVLVRGHQVTIQELYKFLFEIDKPIIQVRIDVILILAEKSMDFAFGFDWSGIYNRQETRERGSGVGLWGFGARSTDYPTPTSSEVSNNSNLLVNPDNFAINLFSSINSLISDKTDIRRITDFMKIPFVFGGPDLNLKRLNLVLNAAETNSKLKIISRPSVLTSNNEVAKLLIGQSIPLQTAIEDVTTANTRNITTINFKDTGIVLEVKPTVSADGKSVTLDVFMEDSQVTSGDTRANDQGIMTNPPTISVIKAKNNVILKSGQTTIIGGLSGNRNRIASNDVPYLSKLPIVGNILFKSKFDYNETTERYIFITPTIIEQQVD